MDANAPSVFQHKYWVVWARYSKPCSGYKVLGPYLGIQIRQDLNEGRISYQDYVWTDGDSDWQRLGECPYFQPERSPGSSPSPLPPPPPLLSRSQLLQSIIIQSVSPNFLDLNQTEPPVPLEADLQDLTVFSILTF